MHDVIVGRTEPNNVCVLGLGYVGLPTALVLANSGFRVRGVDIDSGVISALVRETLHIKESGLAALFERSVAKNSISFSTQPSQADIFIVCVPTPIGFDHSEKMWRADLTFVYQAVDSLIAHLRPGNIVIIESTCPVGTTANVQNYLSQYVADLPVLYCPERVLPGNLIAELTTNSRIVGGSDPIAVKRVQDMYSNVTSGEVICTTAEAAELSKLVENSYRDCNIAFANEIGALSEKVGVDPLLIIDLANKHPRVNILRPGIGVGGHCIPVDPWFLVQDYPADTRMIQAARATNLNATQQVVDKIIKYCKTYGTKTIISFGVAYKPDVSDTRESPALTVINQLIDQNYSVKIIDPLVNLGEKYDQIWDLDQINTKSIFVFLVNHAAFREILRQVNLSSIHYLDFCGITHELNSDE